MSTVDKSVPARQIHGPGRTSLLCRSGVEEDVTVVALAATLAARSSFCWSLRRRAGLFTLEQLFHRKLGWVTHMDLLQKVWLPPCPSSHRGGPDPLNGLKKIPTTALSCRWWEFTHLNLVVLRHLNAVLGQQVEFLKENGIYAFICILTGEILWSSKKKKNPSLMVVNVVATDTWWWKFPRTASWARHEFSGYMKLRVKAAARLGWGKLTQAPVTPVPGRH